MNAGSAALGATLIGALAYTLTNWAKRIRGGDWNGVVTQLAAWGAGIVAVLLVDAANIADAMPVYGTTLGKLDAAGLVIVGLLLASPFGVIHDVKQALDQHGRSDEPNLVS